MVCSLGLDSSLPSSSKISGTTSGEAFDRTPVSRPIRRTWDGETQGWSDRDIYVASTLLGIGHWLGRTIVALPSAASRPPLVEDGPGEGPPGPTVEVVEGSGAGVRVVTHDGRDAVAHVDIGSPVVGHPLLKGLPDDRDGQFFSSACTPFGRRP